MSHGTSRKFSKDIKAAVPGKRNLCRRITHPVQSCRIPPSSAVKDPHLSSVEMKKKKIKINCIVVDGGDEKTLHSCHFGFKNKCSTIMAVKTIVDTIETCFERGQHVSITLCDLSKVFDYESHE
nr:unnamed protein product [Callosobruchus chinensis]